MSGRHNDWEAKALINNKNQGDKLNLPSNKLQWLIQDKKLDPPFYFEICKKGARARIAHAEQIKAEMEARMIREGKRVPEPEAKKYDKTKERVMMCGVLEFNAPNGCAVIPKWLMSELHVSAGQDVEIRLIPGIVKGALIRLQPFQTKFGEMMEAAGSLKPLEDALVHFTALKKDTCITITHKEKEYKLHVLECKPTDRVSVNHRGELKLDLHMAKDAKSAKLMKSKYPNAMEDIWDSDDSDSDVDPDQKQDNRQRPGDQTGEEKIFDVEDAELLADAKVTAIYEANPDAVPPNLSRQRSLMAHEINEEAGFVRCSNCHHEFTKSQLRSHYSRCVFAKMRCPLKECNALVDKSMLDAHNQYAHEKVECECGKIVMRALLPKHYIRLCPSRARCKYCREMILCTNFSSHVRTCGEKILNCPKCSQPAKIRMMLDGSHDRQCIMPCPSCNQGVRANQLEHHRAYECPNRTVRCPTCDGNFPLPTYDDHKIGCERRHAEMIEQHTGEWVCRSCTTRNDSSSNSCSVCHTDKPNSGGRRNPSPGPRRTPAGSTHWACDSCTFRNPASNSTCEICGGAK